MRSATPSQIQSPPTTHVATAYIATQHCFRSLTIIECIGKTSTRVLNGCKEHWQYIWDVASPWLEKVQMTSWWYCLFPFLRVQSKRVTTCYNAVGYACLHTLIILFNVVSRNIWEFCDNINFNVNEIGYSLLFICSSSIHKVAFEYSFYQQCFCCILLMMTAINDDVVAWMHCL